MTRDSAESEYDRYRAAILNTSQGLGFGPLAQGGVARFFGNKNTQYVLVFVVTNEIKH